MRLCLVLVLAVGCRAEFDRSRIPGDLEPFGFGAGVELGTRRCDVTTLADAGPGSLRECITGPDADVYFMVEGTIELSESLEVDSRTTIRGDTAPGGGITLNVSGFAAFEVSSVQDIMIRGLRMQGPFGSGMVDVIDSTQVYLSGLSVRGSDVGVGVQGSSDLTIANCLFWDLEDVAVKVQLGGNRRITIGRNVMYRTEDVLRVQGFAGDVQVLNNIAYGWAWFGDSLGALTMRTDMSGTPTGIDIVGNVVLQASGTASETTSVRLMEVSDVHARDNRFEGSSDLIGDVGEPYTEVGELVSFDAVLDTAGPVPRADEERTFIDIVRSAL